MSVQDDLLIEQRSALLSAVKALLSVDFANDVGVHFAMDAMRTAVATCESPIIIPGHPQRFWRLMSEDGRFWCRMVNAEGNVAGPWLLSSVGRRTEAKAIEDGNNSGLPRFPDGDAARRVG